MHKVNQLLNSHVQHMTILNIIIISTDMLNMQNAWLRSKPTVFYKSKCN